MKKLLLFTLLAAVSFSLNAQRVIFTEPFDSLSVLPADWTTIDADGDSFGWYADFYEGDVLETYAVSESWNEDPLTPDNYLVTPQIDLRNAVAPVYLYWTIGVGDEDWPEEVYQVTVSTTEPTVEGFTNPVFEETLVPEAYYWLKRQVDLSALIGQQIYIAWRHYDCTDNYKLLLDSVKVTVDGFVNTINIDREELKIHPNPTADKIYLSNTSAERIVISNLLGEVVLDSPVVSQKAIDLTHMRKGVYFASFYKNNALMVTRKIIKR